MLLRIKIKIDLNPPVQENRGGEKEGVADVSVSVCARVAPSVRRWDRDGSGAGGRAVWEISSPHHIEKSQ